MTLDGTTTLAAILVHGPPSPTPPGSAATPWSAGSRPLAAQPSGAGRGVPGAVLVALVAPAILAHGLADALAGAITALAALRLPVLAVVVVGVLSAGLLRTVLG